MVNEQTEYAEFDSLLDFYDVCIKTTKSSQGKSGQGSFYGGVTFEQAKQLATTGWPEGTARIEALARRMSTSMVESVLKPEITYDVTGDCFDMGIVMEGTPECWLQWVEGEGESVLGPVHIVYNAGVSGGVSTQTMEARGAAVAALVYVLEAARRPVKVDVSFAIVPSYERRPSKTVRVTVKDYYDPMQIDALAFSLAHPSWFRRFGFVMMDVLGIGPSASRPGDPRHAPKGDVYIHEAMLGAPQWESEKETEKWIQKTLEQQGVTFRPK